MDADARRLKSFRSYILVGMEQIDVDEIAEVNFRGEMAEVRFKDGSSRSYNGVEHPEVFAVLNHWTPPTA